SLNDPNLDQIYPLATRQPSNASYWAITPTGLRLAIRFHTPTLQKDSTRSTAKALYVRGVIEIRTLCLKEVYTCGASRWRSLQDQGFGSPSTTHANCIAWQDTLADRKLKRTVRSICIRTHRIQSMLKWLPVIKDHTASSALQYQDCCLRTL